MTEIILGTLLGLLSATVTESFGHRFFGHPSRWQLKLYFKYPHLFYPVLKAYYQHLVIHHHKTYQLDLFTQFRDAEEKREIDSWIRSKFSRKFANLIWLERYNLTLKGVDGTLPFVLPFFVGPILIGLVLGPVAFGASAVMAFVPMLFSKYLHPLVHHPEEISSASLIVQRVARTKYMRRVVQNHFLHHKYSDTNFNLLLGGDYLLGVRQRMSKEDHLEFEALMEKFDRKMKA